MTLSTDDEITLVEVAVILIGIAITWAVYRRGGTDDEPAVVEPAPSEGADSRTPEENGKAAR